MTIYTIAISGDSISYRMACYFWQFFNITVLDPGNTYSANGMITRQHYRPFLSSPKKIIGVNWAMSGTRLASGSQGGMTIAPTSVDLLLSQTKTNPVLANSYGAGGVVGEPRKTILFTMFGTNPDSVDPAALAANMATYAAARKATGFDYVGVGCLISRTDGIIANFDTSYKDVYNTTLRDSAWRAAHSVDFIVDFAADATMGADGAADNTTYFADKVHPTAAGDAVMGARFATDFGAFLATL